MFSVVLRRTAKKIPGVLRFHAALAAVVAYGRFLTDYRRYGNLLRDGRFPLHWRNRYPCLKDKTTGTNFDRHYIYHPAWAARVLASTKPLQHVDISSSLHFCSLVSAFVPVRFYDFRPADIVLENLQCEQADICALPFPDGSIPSLSCMHVIEHVGLGRYGDPLDPDGDLKAMAELQRVVAPGGDLLLVVPVGKPRLMYNAHRIYSFEQVRNFFAGLELREFSLIPDNEGQDGLLVDAPPKLADSQDYGCGCFWFRRSL